WKHYFAHRRAGRADSARRESEFENSRGRRDGSTDSNGSATTIMIAGKHIHLIGICGTAMASLAGMLKQRGFRVTGSDAAAYPPMSEFLSELGIPVAQPFDARNLQPAPDLVV